MLEQARVRRVSRQKPTLPSKRRTHTTVRNRPHRERLVANDRRVYDSSKTRVQPVFGALEALPTNWLSRLLDLAAGPLETARSWLQQDMTILRADWAGRKKDAKERALFPPVSLLKWLVTTVELEPVPLDGPGENSRKRRLLRDKDPEILREAEEILSGVPRIRAPWCTFEGPTYPDVVIETPDAVVVIEGKRTESGPTTKTAWMPIRHQMLRHLDGAWEIRAGRSVYGVFIVSGRPEKMSTIPSKRWQQALNLTRDPNSVAKSLPHRTPIERTQLSKAVIGLTTWEAVCQEFGLSLEVLVETVLESRD
jgi:hypothetical protein